MAKRILWMREEVKNDPKRDSDIKTKFSNKIFKENLKNLKGLKYIYVVDEFYHYIYAETDDE